jgi:hypothetical protein
MHSGANAGGITNKSRMTKGFKMTELSKDWIRIRHALKHGGAAVPTSGARAWLVVPIDADIARQIISHPAVLPAPAGGYQIGDADYQTYHRRSRSQSPARKVLRESLQ